VPDLIDAVVGVIGNAMRLIYAIEFGRTGTVRPGLA